MPEQTLLEVSIRGPVVAAGVSVDDLNLVTRSLQSAVQEIAVARIRRGSLSRQLTAPLEREIRRACRLAVTRLRPGSVVVEFEFAVPVVDDRLEQARLGALDDVVRGTEQLVDHSFLPSGWTPEVLRSFLRLQPLFRRGVDEFALRLPRLDPQRHAVILPDLLPKLSAALRPYQSGAGARKGETRSYDIGAPPPPTRRKPPKLPLFESGRRELTGEIDEAFGTSDGED